MRISIPVVMVVAGDDRVWLREKSVFRLENVKFCQLSDRKPNKTRGFDVALVNFHAPQRC